MNKLIKEGTDNRTGGRKNGTFTQCFRKATEIPAQQEVKQMPDEVNTRRSRRRRRMRKRKRRRRRRRERE